MLKSGSTCLSQPKLTRMRQGSLIMLVDRCVFLSFWPWGWMEESSEAWVGGGENFTKVEGGGCPSRWGGIGAGRVEGGHYRLFYEVPGNA